ncbi:MBL fold metallo-hydrolase [Nocardioides sediminis]|uniref:MBL fold metallo-hydrolase n=1 Tax=Nocardioides sediminis TaxID=433648 RepID=UPI000D327B89|nr:MBL fold metallo-hydrolase [Nocardioides sediminis]
MEIHSFRTPGLGDQTYLLEHEGKAILVDPQRDISRFLDAAAARDLELRFVLETHLHNDYVSGAEQAALRTGAELVLPAAAAAAYRYTPAFHLEELKGEDGLSIRPLHTPGHTPEHTSYVILLDGKEVAVFSGGSLLVGSAGRPDLLGPERAETLARLQHISLNRLAALPGDVELLPTHGEGSFCTSSGAGLYTSTIANEVLSNPLLQIAEPDDLAKEMLRMPMPIPGFYRYMGPANTLGVKPMPEESKPAISLEELRRDDLNVVDMRPRQHQAAGLFPGSVGIEMGIDFGSWAGWLLPYNEPVAIVADPDQDAEEAVVQLAQIGFDTVVGVVNDLPADGLGAGFTLVELDEALKLVGDDVQVLDVRMPSELEQVRLSGAVERFVPDVFTMGVPEQLDPEATVLVACASGRRASIAASRLVAAGFTDVRVLTGAGVPDLASAA